jgi:UDP-glucuronate 4-epimerase
MKVLVTGTAGFIGFHSARKFLERGDEVVGFDNVNDYYDINIKRERLKLLNNYSNFQFNEGSLEDSDFITEIFNVNQPERVLHLAAQAGVRYSLTNPHPYMNSNIVGFLNILECCRHQKIDNLVYASSSSVYGSNTSLPFKEDQNVDHPLSLYAASKKSNELMAHSYSHLYGLPTTGLRFFTVYGPWGRPDMALFLFTKAILNGETIQVFNNGEMVRDFTYVDDIVHSLVKLVDKIPEGDPEFDRSNPNPATSDAPYRIFNIGNNNPRNLMDYINAIETSLGLEAKKEFLPMQLGDVPETAADTDYLSDWIDFKPDTDISIGVNNFVDWYKEFYKEK